MWKNCEVTTQNFYLQFCRCNGHQSWRMLQKKNHVCKWNEFIPLKNQMNLGSLRLHVTDTKQKVYHW